MELRKEAPDLDRLYDYLHAADALVMNNGMREGRAVVSTTIFQTLGAGCPVVAYDSNLVETIPDEVIIKYRSYEEFEEKLAHLFGDGDVVKTLKKAQKGYVREHSPEEIAKAYLKLFESIVMHKPSLYELRILEKQPGFPHRVTVPETFGRFEEHGSLEKPIRSRVLDFVKEER